MVRAIVAGTILSIVAPARAIQVGSVSVGRSVRSCMIRARISVLHVEGQMTRLGGGESDGIVDAEQLIEKAGAFAALDVTAAATGVMVCVKWHGARRLVRSVSFLECR